MATLTYLWHRHPSRPLTNSAWAGKRAVICWTISLAEVVSVRCHLQGHLSSALPTSNPRTAGLGSAQACVSDRLEMAHVTWV